MKNYLEYLTKKPLKIAWIAIIWLFASIVACILITQKEILVADNNTLVYYLLWLFIVIVFLVANYQPYKEYKDGL
jgi:hypothetical protein